MNNETAPTVITREDIDAVVKQWAEDTNKPMQYTNCISCGEKLPIMFTDYYTGQCQICFFDRKPWFYSSPVGDDYFEEVHG